MYLICLKPLSVINILARLSLVISMLFGAHENVLFSSPAVGNIIDWQSLLLVCWNLHCVYPVMFPVVHS